MTQIYIDLDGVMADFNAGFQKTFDIHPKEVTEDELWERVYSVDNFFLNLPACQGAIAIWNGYLRHLSPIILTACPRTNYQSVAVQKKKWVERYLRDSSPMVLPVIGGHNKWLFMHSQGDILIDDHEKNLIPWRKAGGRGILHRNFTDTINELEMML